ncbi:hypothetical protein KC318_g7791 [Hortaea werneckii]|nr:hypothetical protein KC334_g7623 [Hortaea werneckii]KAI7006882.1 hypothetical protein KC355_g7554 [Hortaea werneckii]KAI7193095.1 hypothetical protein KC324_g5239 [Hortaea werneckii]KAI7528547.1 hypothetical protein KC316_g17738 [Hortaea werneckii]KAI7664310.1 hypothetical protein KC318_g7791 [Hortaea werneckii]
MSSGTSGIRWNEQTVAWEMPEHDSHEPTFVFENYQDSSRRMTPTHPLARFLEEDGRGFSASGYNKIDDLSAFPGATFDQGGCIDFGCPEHLSPDQYYSPSHSGYSSSHLSNDWSDPDSTPYSSPEPVNAYTPYFAKDYYLLDGVGPYQDFQGKDEIGCVALHDVQQYADTEQENVTFGDEISIYGACAHEGYQPATTADDSSPCFIPYLPPQQEFRATRGGCLSETKIVPALRKRQPRSAHRTHTPHSRAKSFDRPRKGRKVVASRGKPTPPSGTAFATCNARSFPCPLAVYGCTSTFGSKNEWKRHVSTQHIRLSFWRCDQCPAEDRQPNDFNRKDLFIQHVRRMHPFVLYERRTAATIARKGKRGSGSGAEKDDAMETALAEIAQRCTIKLRDAPMQSGCLFCDASFEGPSSWEERMEHVGRHMEAARKLDQAAPYLNSWRRDDLTEEWLRAEGLVVEGKGGRLVLTDLK